MQRYAFRGASAVRFSTAVFGLLAALCVSAPCIGSAQSVTGAAFHAPPPAAPATQRSVPVLASAGPRPRLLLPLYSIGDPTDEEQYWLESVNFERANPPAEAQLLENATDPVVVDSYAFFSVELSAMVTAFATIPPAPPLSMNAELLTAARGHSQDMLAFTYQGHTGSDASTPETRIAAQGYSAAVDAENVFAFATSVFEGNAAFEVDWGDNPPTGMQNPPQHRLNEHNTALAEVGIGVVDGTASASGTEYGPVLCTMDFGTQQTYTPFVTGVAYYDVNGNGVYDMGEGLGGVGVGVSGASYSAVTANSGGYSVPTTGTGSQTVTFSVSGASDQQVTTTLTGTSNVKVDLKLTYIPPVVSGTANPPTNQASTYHFTALPGATSYQFKQAQLFPFTTVETGASGTDDFIVSTTGDYNVIALDEPLNSPVLSFHLAHPTTDGQALELNITLFPTATSILKFESVLGYASTTEIARAQVSADGGVTWQDVWTQAGTNGAGASTFSAQSISLAQFAGEEIMVRFAYDASGSYYPQTSAGVGFYVNDIQVTNASQLANLSAAPVASGTSFNFDPTVSGSFVLAVRAQVMSRTFPWGPDYVVSAVGTANTAPTVTTNAATSVTGTSAILNGSVNPNGEAASAFFQWGLNESYLDSTGTASLGSGSASVPATDALSGLTPGATYHYRVVAVNVSGTSYGLDQVFTTMAAPPAVVTEPATSVTAATAILNGTVNPNGLDTSIAFQFGLTASYGEKSNSADAGAGSVPIPATCDLTGLKPNTTYHFRITGSNADGVVDGADQSFTTGTGISFTAYKAKYLGVIGTVPPANSLSGIITINVSAKGAFTASGVLDGKKFAFAGQFDADGDYFATLKNGVEVQLQLRMQPGAVIAGAIASSATSSAITLEPVQPAVAPLAFTFRLPAPSGMGLPQGNGYGTIKIAAKSTTATFAGKLGDGTAISFGGSVILDGSTQKSMIPVYIPLYGGKGVIFGVLTREMSANGDLDGMLNWIKPQTTGAFFPAAFATQVNLYGSLYAKPPAGTPAITLTSGTGSVSFTAGGLTNPPLQKLITLSTSNKITVTNPGPDKLKMTINPSNGLFSGTFVGPNGTKAVPFNGALFQGAGFNFGLGVFKGPANPGAVDLQ